MRLFQLTAEVRALLDATDEAGELTDAAVARLEELTPLAEDRVDVLAGAVEERERRIAGRKATLDRLMAANRADANWIIRAKQALLDWMRATGQSKLRTSLHSVSVCQSPPSARCIVDPADLPDYLRRVKIEPDLAAAIEFWRNHGMPAGFEIDTGREHVRLR